MKLYHNAKDINKWVYSDLESCNEDDYCCNYDFFHCVANDAGQLDTRRAKDRYELLGSIYYMCGVCMDHYSGCLDELANKIKDNYDYFDNWYVDE